MMKVRVLAALIFFLSGGNVPAQEKITIGGSGSIIQEMQDLAKAYNAKDPAGTIEVITTSMSSTGGLEGTKAGRLTIGLVTRAPREDDGGKLVYRVVGRSAVGVAVNKSNNVSSLSESQVCEIFTGKIRSWKEVGGAAGNIMVLTRKSDDANTETLRDKMACFKNVKITSEAVALTRGSEVLNALNGRSEPVGIVNLGSVFRRLENVKALAINGVAAIDETVQSGKYRFYHELGIVTLGEPQGLAKRFLEFAFSPEGQKILYRRGMTPVL